MASDRASLEGWQMTDRFRIGQGLDFDPAIRARNTRDELVGRRAPGSAPRSATLIQLNALLGSDVLAAIDSALLARPTTDSSAPHEKGAAGGDDRVVPMDVGEDAPLPLASRLAQALPPGSSREQLELAARLGALAAKRAAGAA
eukprot:2727788-Prymnesium_polylepis.1